MEKQLKTKNNFFKAFSVKELIAFIIAVLLILTGLTFLVLGLIDDYTNIYNSILTTPNTSMKSMMGGIGFTWFGVIVNILGAIILAFSLSYASKSEDREKEREARRRQRRESLSSNNEVPTYSTIMNSSQEKK